MKKLVTEYKWDKLIQSRNSTKYTQLQNQKMKTKTHHNIDG